MVLVWILLLLGFILLIKGADYFVEGSSSVAKALRIPGVVIGLTVVAMGTSAPELAVSVTAALTGNNDIAVGNVIGGLQNQERCRRSFPSRNPELAVSLFWEMRWKTRILATAAGSGLFLTAGHPQNRF